MNKNSLPKAFASFVLFAKGEQRISDMRRFTSRTKALTSLACVGTTVVNMAAYAWSLSTSSTMIQSAVGYNGNGDIITASAGLVSLLAISAIQLKLLTGPITRCARLGIHVAFAHPNKAM